MAVPWNVFDAYVQRSNGCHSHLLHRDYLHPLNEGD